MTSADALAGTSWPSDALEEVESCPVCGNSRSDQLYEGLTDRLFGAPGVWSIRRCASCGAGYLDPRPTDAALPLAYSAYYTHAELEEPSLSRTGLAGLKRRVRNGYLDSRLGYRLEPTLPLASLILAPLPFHRRQARLAVRDLPLPGSSGGAPRLLDVGCGNGMFLLEAAEAGWHAEGIDTDPECVAAARRRGLTVHLGELEDVRLADRSFDAITMAHVIEHVPRPQSFLGECRRLLSADGHLWLATPNFASPGHERYGRDWRGLEPPRHLVLYTPTSLQMAFESAGFSFELLQPPRSGWMHRQSTALRTGGEEAGRRDDVIRTVTAGIQDVRSLLSRGYGEELCAVGSPVGPAPSANVDSAPS